MQGFNYNNLRSKVIFSPLRLLSLLISKNAVLITLLASFIGEANMRRKLMLLVKITIGYLNVTFCVMTYSN